MSKTIELLTTKVIDGMQRIPGNIITIDDDRADHYIRTGDAQATDRQPLTIDEQLDQDNGARMEINTDAQVADAHSPVVQPVAAREKEVSYVSDTTQSDAPQPVKNQIGGRKASKKS